MSQPRRHSAEEARARYRADSYARTLTILVVEDDFAVAELLRTVINATPGWGAIVVHEPRAAIEVLRHVPVDLLVLDVNLPEMTGPELLEHLGAEAFWQSPPVVLMSANATAPEVERASSSANVARFIPKPFDLDVLMDALREATTPPRGRRWRAA